MITCTRRIEFDAGHRVMEHESKCRHLHGHRYAVEATFAAKDLDILGRVIDFGEVRKILGDWIDANWDHATILSEKDRLLGEAIAGKTMQTIFYLPANPTAENMAEYLLNTVCPELFGKSEARCIRIRLYETAELLCGCDNINRQAGLSSASLRRSIATEAIQSCRLPR